MLREMLADRASTVLWRQWERFRASSDIHGNPRAAVLIPLDRLFLPATDDIPGTAARHSLTRTCHSGVIRSHWWWCTARLCIPIHQGTGVEDSETRVGPYVSSFRSSVIVVGANFYQRTNRHARELGLALSRMIMTVRREIAEPYGLVFADPDGRLPRFPSAQFASCAGRHVLKEQVQADPDALDLLGVKLAIRIVAPIVVDK